MSEAFESIYDAPPHQKSQPIKKIQDKWKLVPAYLKLRGLVRQHIDSFNYFINSELKEIIRAESNRRITLDKHPYYYMEYLDIRVLKPTIEEDYSKRQLYPQECRLRDLNYSAPVVVDIEHVKGNERYRERNVPIGYMPIMLGSSNCWLAGRTHEELAKIGECPYDPRGYFVVRGVERVVLIQQQMSKNRIIVELDAKKNLQAQVTSSTHERKSRTTVGMKNNKFYLRHNSLVEDIPVVVAFKALGMSSDQEILQMVGSSQKYAQAFALSIYECSILNVLTQTQALAFIGKRVKSVKMGGSIGIQRGGLDHVYEALDILKTLVIAHVPAQKSPSAKGGVNMLSKARYLAVMVRRIIEAQHGAPLDDKDYYGNKRLELAGQLLSLLFEDLLKKINFDLRLVAEKILPKCEERGDAFDITRYFRPQTLTQGMANAIATGNWSLKRFKMERAGVTQVLSRQSYISALGMMTRITSQFQKTRKISGPRSLQPSQWGMLCPSDTPEGESCGLVKNFALLTHVTTDSAPEPLHRLSLDLGLEDIALLSGQEIHSKTNYTVYLNGTPIGIHRSPGTFLEDFRLLRRRGKINPYVSAYENADHRAIYISCDGGRLVRPLLLLSPTTGKPFITEQYISEIEAGFLTFDDCLKQGMLEFLDVNEENNALIALNESYIKPGLHTHLEIDPLTILGCVAGLIPFPHHNQSPRNTYQCAMGKQAVGAIALNQMQRVDTVLALLLYPQSPLVKTKTIEMINFQKLPAGQNAMVAIMSFTGYDIEDAVILNKASLDRGYQRSLQYRRTAVDFKKYADGTSDNLQGPPTLDPSIKHPPPIMKKFKALDPDGIARISSEVHTGDLLVNKQVPLGGAALASSALNGRVEQQYRPQPAAYKGLNPAYVDRVILTSTSETPALIKVVLRQSRRPELGDKFSSRHGQKGVCGLIVPQEDMPFAQTGWCPDMVMNPHGFPSRMTVGKMIELMSGKAGALIGEFKDGTAFGGQNVEEMGKLLIQNGYSYQGKDLLMSGITGQLLPCYVFSGPVFYQRLKHMVQDKIHARSRGPKAVLTRQPTEGRSRDGGLRLGEMERDCLIGYGAANLLQERLMLASDVFQVDVCEKCGYFGYNGFCQYCQSTSQVHKIKMPYACKLLFQELQSMNIRTRLILSESN